MLLSAHKLNIPAHAVSTLKSKRSSVIHRLINDNRNPKSENLLMVSYRVDTMIGQPNIDKVSICLTTKEGAHKDTQLPKSSSKPSIFYANKAPENFSKIEPISRTRKISEKQTQTPKFQQCKAEDLANF